MTVMKCCGETLITRGGCKPSEFMFLRGPEMWVHSYLLEDIQWAALSCFQFSLELSVPYTLIPSRTGK